MAVPPSDEFATCPDCRALVRLNADGTIRRHAHSGSWCPASKRRLSDLAHSRAGLASAEGELKPATVSEAGRAVCPRCARSVALRIDGQMRAHRGDNGLRCREGFVEPSTQTAATSTSGDASSIGRKVMPSAISVVLTAFEMADLLVETIPLLSRMATGTYRVSRVQPDGEGFSVLLTRNEEPA